MSMFLRRPSRRAKWPTATQVTPVAGPGLLDAQVDHDDVDLGELGQFGSSTRTRVSITWPSTSTSPGLCEELPHRYVGGGQGDGAGFDRGDPTDGDEDASTSEQLDDQTGTLGCWRTMLILITTSRTRPMDSPSGPKTTIPASRAA
jgi:hypothetical protein